ncbi:hypothetical protein RAB80_017359 [Fusarium oxysporum f. sp. vasinfectum]|nr:hypothetical protein RAB80_017359 [Fusarium oxysporum f. sp. vasinfectum]
MARRDYGLPGYSVVLFGRKSDRRPSKHSCLVEDRSERVNEFDVIGNEQACYYMDSEWNRSAHEGLLFWISVVVRNQDRGTALGDLVRRTVESMARSRTASIFVGVRREPEEGDDRGAGSMWFAQRFLLLCKEGGTTRGGAVEAGNGVVHI